MCLLLGLLAIVLFTPQVFSAGKCDTSTPPRTWAVTKGIGIQKWATAGVPTTGKEFCVTLYGMKTKDSILFHSTLPCRGVPSTASCEAIFDGFLC
ncbi:hypothetical protein Y032_0090g2405 [Ancylostoma ceylanicum]|uniref:Uncharacterized protein n=1 Tax=Ancylostoma ceylanicum TaxID=53326 RepID=A0A016TN65_9BILA|nr:hypothetical protein Y032_0090g2405 [Ancylostoma ceylanicum]